MEQAIADAVIMIKISIPVVSHVFYKELVKKHNPQQLMNIVANCQLN